MWKNFDVGFWKQIEGAILGVSDGSELGSVEGIEENEGTELGVILGPNEGAPLEVGSKEGETEGDKDGELDGVVEGTIDGGTDGAHAEEPHERAHLFSTRAPPFTNPQYLSRRAAFACSHVHFFLDFRPFFFSWTL